VPAHGAESSEVFPSQKESRKETGHLDPEILKKMTRLGWKMLKPTWVDLLAM
jgi:hypothetical protein